MTPLYAIGRVILIPLVKILFFLKVNGKGNIPKNGGFILCSNHLSNFDPVLIGVAQRRQLFFMAKSELFRNKFFGWLIRKLGAFPVERGAGDGKAINTAEKIINEGKTLGIFIEGTRSKTGELLRPKAGAAMFRAPGSKSASRRCYPRNMPSPAGLHRLPAPLRKEKSGTGFPSRTIHNPDCRNTFG